MASHDTLDTQACRDRRLRADYPAQLSRVWLVRWINSAPHLDRGHSVDTEPQPAEAAIVDGCAQPRDRPTAGERLRRGEHAQLLLSNPRRFEHPGTLAHTVRTVKKVIHTRRLMRVEVNASGEKSQRGVSSGRMGA